MLLTKHKNKLLTLLQEYGFKPALFVAKDKIIDSQNYFCISVRSSKILFAVQPVTSTFDRFIARKSRFSVGFPLSDRFTAGDEDDLASIFQDWLSDVVKPYLDDISTPNLWQILEQTRSRTKRDLGTSDESEFFSDEEKTQISLSLNEFRMLVVKNYNPNKEELEAVDARLKYLSDAVDKHNKFDWKGVAINTIIAVSVTLALNPEQSNQLFQLFSQVFSNIIYLLP